MVSEMTLGNMEEHPLRAAEPTWNLALASAVRYTYELRREM
jgi:hypothetical protein